MDVFHLELHSVLQIVGVTSADPQEDAQIIPAGEEPESRDGAHDARRLGGAAQLELSEERSVAQVSHPALILLRAI